jgi:hypothetical protein
MTISQVNEFLTDYTHIFTKGSHTHHTAYSDILERSEFIRFNHLNNLIHCESGLSLFLRDMELKQAVDDMVDFC